MRSTVGVHVTLKSIVYAATVSVVVVVPSTVYDVSPQLA